MNVKGLFKFLPVPDAIKAIDIFTSIFFESIFFVQTLRGSLYHRCFKNKSLVTFPSSFGLQVFENFSSISFPLQAGIHTHPFDFGVSIFTSFENSHCDNFIIKLTYNKFTIVIQIDSLDIIKIGISFTMTFISANFLHRNYMQLQNLLKIFRFKSTDGKHVTPSLKWNPLDHILIYNYLFSLSTLH